MKKQLLLIVLFLHAFNISAISEDAYKFAHDIGKLSIIFLVGLTVPAFNHNPPQTNFKEYFAHKFLSETQEDHEIKKTIIQIQELTKKIDSSDDEHDKLILSQEKEELENKILKLQTKKKTCPPLFKYSAPTSLTKEGATVHQTIQGQIISQALNVKQSSSSSDN
jgi:hypothetical protein